MKHFVRITLLLVLCAMTLCSCQAPRPKPQYTRTTAYMKSSNGEAVPVVTETPYEPTTFHDAGVAMMQRP